jgi:hypothetical protein
VTVTFLVSVGAAESSRPTLIFQAKEAAHSRCPENPFVCAATALGQA